MYWQADPEVRVLRQLYLLFGDKLDRLANNIEPAVELRLWLKQASQPELRGLLIELLLHLEDDD